MNTHQQAKWHAHCKSPTITFSGAATMLSANSRFLSNISWMLGAELLAKVSRVVTVIAMAAYLPVVSYGVAMLALALYEIIRVFSRAGAGAKVIQCNDEDLERYSQNASALQWIVCLALAALQIACAKVIAAFYQLPDLELLLTLLALTYLGFPIVSIKVFQVQRSNNLKYFAVANAVVLSVDNLMIVAGLLAGLGVYAVVLAKFAAVFTWVVFFTFARYPTIRPQIHWPTFKYLSAYSLRIFMSDLSRIARTQIDVIIAGKLLTPELLGLYSFAKNSGVGLAQSLINAYSQALYPHLCKQLKVSSQWQVARSALSTSALTATLFIIQAALAPWYVTVLFDQQWHDAGALVAILCLPSCFAILVDTRGFFFRASGNTHSEFWLLLSTVLCSAAVILVTQPQSAIELAYTTLFASVLWLVPILPFIISTWRVSPSVEV